MADGLRRRTENEPADAFRILVEMSDDFVAISGLDARILFLNAAGRALVGLTADDDVTQYHVVDFLDPATLAHAERVERPAVLEHGSWSGESALRHFESGAIVPVAAASYLLRDADDNPIAFATVRRDLSAESRAGRVAQRRLAEARAIAAMAGIALESDLRETFDRVGSIILRVLDTNTFGVVRADGERLDVLAHGRPDSVPRRFTLPWGTGSHVGLAAASGSSVLVRDYLDDGRFNPRIALDEGARSGIAVPIVLPHGLWGVLAVHHPLSNQFDNDDVAFVEAVAGVLGQAITQDAAEAALRHRALHDPLTDLPNRSLIRDRLSHALAQRGPGRSVALALLDLNGFKHVNDSFGHSTGDRVLIECARRLQNVARDGDTIGRLGGDEFVVICEGADAFASASATARAFLDACSQPIEVDGERLHVDASVGIAASDASLSAPSELLRAADEAMYVAKRSRVDLVVYQPEVESRANRRSRMIFALREALDNGTIEVRYQPIWHLAGGRVVGIEALARWNDGRFGDVDPAEFIPIAEESGMIAQLGAHVLSRAAASTVRARAVVPDLTLHVNVSPHELARDSYVRTLRATLAAAGLPLDAFGLEITEAVLIEDVTVARAQLAEICGLGVAVSLDDFGTGFSSLNYLQRLPEISALKIDKSFASALQPGIANPIVVSIVTMAHALGKSVVAEGIETAQQEQTLRELGCEFGQGFLLAQPLDEDALIAFLRAR